MRRGEKVKLRWSRVHLQEGYLELPASITKTGSPASCRSISALSRSWRPSLGVVNFFSTPMSTPSSWRSGGRGSVRGASTCASAARRHQPVAGKDGPARERDWAHHRAHRPAHARAPLQQTPGRIRGAVPEVVQVTPTHTEDVNASRRVGAGSTGGHRPQRRPPACVRCLHRVGSLPTQAGGLRAGSLMASGIWSLPASPATGKPLEMSTGCRPSDCRRGCMSGTSI